MSTKPNIQKVHNQQALGLSIYILIILLVLGCDDYKIVPVRTAQVVLHPVSKNTNSASLKSSKEPELLMQASGWIEPDPFSVRIPALYDGFVNEVYVHEGELVRTGQKLVSLIADDAQLAFRMAHNELEEAKSREHEIALELSLQKLSLEKAQYENLKHLALLNEQEDLLDRLESLPVGSIPFRDLNRTRYKTESMKFSADSSLKEVEIARVQTDLLSQKLESQKNITAIKSVHYEKAILDLNRTEISSPIDGRILKLFASPGKRLMQKMDAPEASTAAIVYKDEKLQARIDVPLDEASKLFIGQEVEITCSLLPNSKFRGQLTRILGEADLQRNTLQVKVKILDPDEKLRPEMLCRARFLSKIEHHDTSVQTNGLGLFIPDFLYPEDNKSVSNLWVLGADGKSAEIREVKFGNEVIDKYISVLSGLKAGDKIIINPPSSLQPGDSVRILKQP